MGDEGVKFIGAPVQVAARTLATISIVSHGHGALIEDLLRDLARQEDIQHCLIVLTLNLPDEVVEIPQSLNTRVIRNLAPKGFAENHNSAFEYSEGDVYLVLNPDLRIPNARTIASLVNRASREVGLGVLSPMILGPSGRREDFVRSNLTPWSVVRRAFGLDRGPVAHSEPAAIGRRFYWVAGIAMAFNAATFRKVGGFDRQFRLYCEDYDLCARLYAQGYSIIVDDRLSLVHRSRRWRHESSRHFFWHVSGLMKVWASRPFWQAALGSFDEPPASVPSAPPQFRAAPRSSD